MTTTTMQSNQRLEDALINVDQETVEAIIREAMVGESPIKIAGGMVSETLKNIGDMWERGDLSLSQVYMAGVICEKVLDTVLPPQSPNRLNQPKTAIAVLEDYHQLGKTIIFSALRATGIELTDLGAGLSVEELAHIVKKDGYKILLISVLMVPSALRIKNLIELLKDVDVKIVVGGAPFRFDDKLAEEIGAEYCGKDSAEALDILKKLMGD